MKERKAKARRMKEDTPVEAGSLPAEDDSIEILEVVGLEEGKSRSAQEVEGEGESSHRSEPPDSIPYSRQQLYDMLLRKQAEFENARKRMEREREESERRIWMNLLQRLLPIVDNFQRALAGSPSTDAFHQGVALTLQQMTELLAREGLEEVRSVGERFDPHVHEAVETRVVMGLEEGIVLEELLKGYRFRGHLLRPALVRVSAKGEGESGEGA
jgi:molecular chaperone GrpE